MTSLMRDTWRMKLLKIIAYITLAASASLGATERAGSLPTIEKIVAYTDQDYGFQLAIPDAWTRIYAAEDDAEIDALEPGYAIGFESPRSDSFDIFADYLMVEILPGANTGAFESNGSNTKVVVVDNKMAIVDEIELEGFDINGEQIDLIVFQAEIVELGFTVGIFAIGEQREAAVLKDAFELALKTFKIPEDPFAVS